MPSSSPAQAKTMRAIAHGWKPTGSAAGIPVSVAKEFAAADQVRGRLPTDSHRKVAAVLSRKR